MTSPAPSAPRPLCPDDLEAVLEIERASFSAPWPPSVFEMAMTSPGLLALGLDHEDTLVAYVVASCRDDEVLLANVAVSPDHRRHGFGTVLLRRVLDWGHEQGARYCRLEVRLSNRGAMDLYRRMGFAPVAIQPAYYTFPVEDAMTMVHRYD